MRELNECRSEIFLRSAKRIAARKKKRNRILGLSISMCLLVAVYAVITQPPTDSAYKSGAMDGFTHHDGLVGNINGTPGNVQGGIETDKPGDTGSIDGNGCIMPDKIDFGNLDSFSFSLTWGCYGISFYDSATGDLVKTTDATHPEDYVTTYQLTDTQKQQIFDLIKGLNVTAYPDTYDPHAGGLASNPSMTLILSVKTDKIQKAITAEDIALTFNSENSQGRRFLSACKAIQDILMETDEWKALPEYEFFYD